MPDLLSHLATLKRRNAIAQLIAGFGMGVCLVAVMAIVLGSM